MGVVCQQRHAIFAADLGNAPDIRHIAQIIRTGQIHSEGLLRLFQNGFFHRFGGYGTAEVIVSGPEPANRKVQQHRRMKKALVGIPSGQAPSLTARLGIGQIQHGPDGQTGPFSGIHRGPAEKPGRVGFTFGEDSLRVEQVVCPADLCNVHGFAAQRPRSLVPRHMEPDGSFSGISPDKITDRGAGHA